MPWNGPLRKLDEFRQELSRDYKSGMRTTGLIFADDAMMAQIRKDDAPEQVANVATLPGIVGSSMAMPDIHWGYGFPIGGVAAMDSEKGVVSPGGVGFDINCGVRLVRTNLRVKDVQSKVKDLIDSIFVNVPSGLGSHGKVRLSRSDIDKVLDTGMEWAVEKGYGWAEDLQNCEDGGRMPTADSSKVSQKAKERGMPQLGSLGAGNHFLEVQKVAEIYEPEIAKAFGINEVDQVMVMIHTGSRGAGHQIATDYLSEMEHALRRYNFNLPDRQLACAPVNSKEADDYFKAMSAGANYAWANRQLILHWVRESFENVMRQKADALGMQMVYDVCHNIAKLEEHTVDGKRQKLYVHRKGATRAFAAGRNEVNAKYRDIGQPVLIPGDMGTASYVLVGTELAMKETFGSTCHGAGRIMSRNEAIRRFTSSGITQELAAKGIYVRAASKDVLTEEAPSAYKRVGDVVRVAHGAGISRMVAKMVPMGVMKG
ncbi:MAG: RtcB family protein [Euryarchaeota archaeon]|nr:RtcB family protein [Euryarchaeota archaeon]